MAEKAKRIILANLDLEQVLIELTESSSTNDERERTGSFLEGHGCEITDFIATQADHLGVSQSLLATQMIIKRMKKAGSLLTCDPMLAFACFLLNNLMLDTDYLLELVLKDLNNYSIVSIWKLHQAAILPLEKILARISQNKKQALFQDYLIMELVSLSSSPAPSHQKPLMRDVTRFLILSSSDASSEAHVCKEILLQTILRSYSQDSSPEYTILNAVEELSAELSSDAVDWMCQSVMRTLSTAPVITSAPSAFCIQHKCSSTMQPPHTSSMFTKIASLLGPVEGLKIIRNALEYHELNWVTVLSYEVCFLHCHKESSRHLRGMIAQLCSEALSDRNEHLLTFAMLLAQQASLEGAHIFPSYADWIREMFGNSQNTLIQAKTQLQFLLKCLVQLIPHHTPDCLRSHIKHPPRQLAKCHGDIADYTSLVKARLRELNEPLSAHGSSSLPNGGRSGEFAQAEDYVERMLEDFKQSDCTTLPTKLVEMSIFKKPYFTECFLRSLLAPRQNPAVPDAREKLITMLSRREKIPNKMLATYRRECQKYQDNAQSPVVVSQSLQQILPILEKIVENYTSNKLAVYFSRLSGALSALSIRSVMSDGLSLYCPGLTGEEVEMVDLLLERIIKSVVNICTHLSKMTTDHVSARFDIVSMFVRMLEGHPNLHWPLLIRLWELLHIQSSKLSHSHLLGLAILLAKLFTVSANYRAVQFTSCCMNAGPPVLHTLQSSSEYAVFLLESMTHCSTADMLAVVRLFTQFFQHILTTESHSILSDSQLQSPLMKLSYLTKRLAEASYSTSQTDIACPSKLKVTALLKWAREIRKKTPGLQSLYSSVQIDLEQWMRWEYIGVDPITDMLPGLIRQQYRRETFYQLAAGNTAHSMNKLFNCLVQLQLIQERVGANCKEHKSCITRLAAINWRDGIQLMTEITASLPPSLGTACLVTAVTNLLETVCHTRSLEHRYTVSSCVSTCLSLPPYLLFTDHLSSAPCQDSLINTAHLLRNYLFPVGVHYVLPIAFTHHILKGLLQWPESFRCCEQFVQSSPLFIASLLRWWSHLKELVGSQLGKPVLHLIDELATSVLSEDFSSKTDLGPITVNLYCDLVSKHVVGERILDTMIPANDEVCLLLMDCCVRQLCSNPIWLDDESRSSSQLLIAKHIMNKCHMVWSVFDSNDGHTSVLLANFRKEFPLLHNIQLLPLALFRILAVLDRPFLLKLCSMQPGFVSFCHQAHQQCLQLCGNDDTISPLSLKSIRQMSSLIQIISTKS